MALIPALLLVGCRSGNEPSHHEHMSQTAATQAPEPAPVPAPPAITEAPAAPMAPNPAAPQVAPAPETPKATDSRPTVRIDAGASAPYTDSQGNTWLADQGFEGGDMIERAGDLEIANTKDPGLFRTEHYGMTSFSYKLPNGKYTVKLHFAETYEGISGAGQRVFSFKVGGQEFKDFDVWAKAGGGQKAYVQSVDVDVTDGKLDITFTSADQSPEITAIEINPAP